MKIHHLPIHPVYCLDKLQKTKQDFQKQHVACQKKLQVCKVVMERKRKELAQLKRILAANKKEAQRRRERGCGLLLVGSEDPVVMQQHYITVLEREIVNLQRKSKKLQKMSHAAIKIVDVMEEEYRRAVLLHK